MLLIISAGLRLLVLVLDTCRIAYYSLVSMESEAVFQTVHNTPQTPCGLAPGTYLSR